MGPKPLDPNGASTLAGGGSASSSRFEEIGLQIMNRTGGGGAFAHDPVASVLSDRDKRRIAAQILGQAYVTAHNLIQHNRKGVEHIADQVVAAGRSTATSSSISSTRRSRGAEDRSDPGGRMADVVEKRPAVDSVPKDKPVYGGRFAVVQLFVMLAFAGLLGPPPISFPAIPASRGRATSRRATKRSAGRRTWRTTSLAATSRTARRLRSSRPSSSSSGRQTWTASPSRASPPRVSAARSHSSSRRGRRGSTCSAVQATNCGPADPGTDDVSTLLREESLELALYTFKYWPEIDSVVALLPSTAKLKPAVLFRRRKLTDALSKPLAATLPQHDLVTTSSITEAEVLTVKRLTESSLFGASFEQTPNGHTLLVLGRSSAGSR